MATGVITTAQIANDSAKFIAPMLRVRDNGAVMDKLVDTKTLPNGYGLVYNEPYVGALTASTLVDGVEFDSPQVFSDTNIQVTATEYGVQTIITQLSNDQVRENLFGLAGELMGAAMVYKLDTGGATQIGAFGGSIGSGTATLTAGHITAAAATIRVGEAQSGATARTGARSTGDPAQGPLVAVIHEYQRRALAAQLSGTFSGTSDGAISTTAPTMNFGTNRVGLSDYQRAWLEEHYMGNLDGVRIVVNNNITRASNAAKGAVFAKNALIHLKFRAPNEYKVLTTDGRAWRQTLSDTWGWGERADVWGVTLNCAAVIPTS